MAVTLFVSASSQYGDYGMTWVAYARRIDTLEIVRRHGGFDSAAEAIQEVEEWCLECLPDCRFTGRDPLNAEENLTPDP